MYPLRQNDLLVYNMGVGLVQTKILIGLYFIGYKKLVFL